MSSNILEAQDTTVVVRYRHKCTTDPFLRKFIVQNDTVFQTRSRDLLTSDFRNLRSKWEKNNYFVFFDFRGNIIMEGYWMGEGIYGPFIYYHRNGNIKVKGFHGMGGNCGTWLYYRKNGVFKKERNLEECY